jgi:hypothetical protein
MASEKELRKRLSAEMNERSLGTVALGGIGGRLCRQSVLGCDRTSDISKVGKRREKPGSDWSLFLESIVGDSSLQGLSKFLGEEKKF